MTQRTSNQENGLPTSNEQTLVERLRDCVKVTFSAGLHGVESDCRQAADELDRQRAEIERLTRERDEAQQATSAARHAGSVAAHARDRLRAALETATKRFDYIAAGASREIANPVAGAAEARAALSGEPSSDETAARRMTRAEADAMNRAFWRSVEIIDDIDDREEVAPGDARYYRPSENPSICPYGQSDCETTRGGVCQCAMPAEQASRVK